MEKLVGATPFVTVHDMLEVVAVVETPDTRRTLSVGNISFYELQEHACSYKL